jgi:hypothetical protein
VRGENWLIWWGEASERTDNSTEATEGSRSTNVLGLKTRRAVILRHATAPTTRPIIVSDKQPVQATGDKSASFSAQLHQA